MGLSFSLSQCPQQHASEEMNGAGQGEEADRNLKEASDERNQEFEEKKRRIRVLERENEKLSLETQAGKKKLKEKTRKMDNWEKNRIYAQNQLKEAEAEIARLEKKLEVSERKRDQLKVMYQEKKDEYDNLEKKCTELAKTLNLRQVRYCSMSAFLDDWKKACPQLGLDDASKIFSFHLKQLRQDEINKLPIPLYQLEIILDAWDVYRERGNAEAHQGPATEEEFSNVYDGLINDLKKCAGLREGTVSHWEGLKAACWQKLVEENESLVDRVAKSKKKRAAVLSPSKKR